MNKEIKNYQDFIDMLLYAGFTMGGGNADGIYAIINWGWQESPPYDTPVRWHTECKETDPWEWRIRVLDERNDIAYGKLFFKKSGLITREWYPYFLAARRGGLSFDDAYESGTISHTAKRIYDVVAANHSIPSHAIKQEAGFAREEKSAFDRGMTELQMAMYITTNGQQFRGHGMPSCTFCTVEDFWGEDVFAQAAKLGKAEAAEKIRQQVLALNPHAQDKKITKFIYG